MSQSHSPCEVPSVEGPWRVLAVDYGSVRLGLALSDTSRQLATPLVTLDAKKNLMKRFKELVAEWDVALVVLGRPFRSDGSPGTIDDRILHFAQTLGSMGMQVEFWNEAYSSQRAQGLLTESDQRRGPKSGRQARKEREDGRLDRAAAAVFLQEFLDANAQLARSEE
jgi:putative holliday junction resolvase